MLKVGVKIDRRHQATVIVIDAAIVRRIAVNSLIGPTIEQGPEPRDLREFVDVEKAVEEGVGDWYIFGFTVREDLLQLTMKTLPFTGAVKIIDHDESTS